MNWVKKLFRKKEHIRFPTFGDWVWCMYWSLRENNALSNYEANIQQMKGCDFMVKSPKRKMKSKYGLNSQYMNHLVWWILEQYEEGNLIEKPKEDAQPKP